MKKLNDVSEIIEDNLYFRSIPFFSRNFEKHGQYIFITEIKQINEYSLICFEVLDKTFSLVKSDCLAPVLFERFIDKGQMYLVELDNEEEAKFWLMKRN